MPALLASATEATRACESSGASTMPSTFWVTKFCTIVIWPSRSFSNCGTQPVDLDRKVEFLGRLLGSVMDRLPELVRRALGNHRQTQPGRSGGRRCLRALADLLRRRRLAAAECCEDDQQKRQTERRKACPGIANTVESGRQSEAPSCCWEGTWKAKPAARAALRDIIAEPRFRIAPSRASTSGLSWGCGAPEA